MDRQISRKGEEGSGGDRARLRLRLLDAGPGSFHGYVSVEYLLTLNTPHLDTKPLAKRLLNDFRHDAARRPERREHSGPEDTEATALRLLEARVEGQPVLSTHSWH